MQEKNGGALKVNLLASVVFEGTATFTDISIKTTDLGNGDELTRKGGAIHNKVLRQRDRATIRVALYFTIDRCTSPLSYELNTWQRRSVIYFEPCQDLRDSCMDLVTAEIFLLWFLCQLLTPWAMLRVFLLFYCRS